jgi:hypothetical protein
MTTARSILLRPAGWLLAGVLAVGGAALVGGCDDHHYGGGIHYDNYGGYVEPYPVHTTYVVGQGYYGPPRYRHAGGYYGPHRPHHGRYRH